MKPVIQKLPLAEDVSFYAHTHTTPTFEYVWHQHIEYELILMKKSKGLAFIGTYTGEYEEGDIFFIGSNVPHVFQKNDNNATASALVIQFRDDFMGKALSALPEGYLVRKTFDKSMLGIKISQGKTKAKLTQLFQEIEQVNGFEKILKLLEIIQFMSEHCVLESLSNRSIGTVEVKNKERLDKVFQHTIDSFKKTITLNNIASLINMSVPAFCKYFKTATGKTYFDFLNEVRIGYACNLLIDSDMNISEVAYSSGFNTIAHFNRQFTKIKHCKPSDFRKKYISINNNGLQTVLDN
jgi:AraC-like DNA-binding protein